MAWLVIPIFIFPQSMDDDTSGIPSTGAFPTENRKEQLKRWIQAVAQRAVQQGLGDTFETITRLEEAKAHRAAAMESRINQRLDSLGQQIRESSSSVETLREQVSQLEARIEENRRWEDQVKTAEAKIQADVRLMASTRKRVDALAEVFRLLIIVVDPIEEWLRKLNDALHNASERRNESRVDHTDITAMAPRRRSNDRL